MNELQWGPFLIMWSGALLGLAGWWLGRRMAARKRGTDERYFLIWKNARAGSWLLTLFAIYVLYSLMFLGVSISAPAALGIVMLVHMLGWAVLGIIHQFRL
jgi:hypothetical protein